jgi:hypothetical protein
MILGEKVGVIGDPSEFGVASRPWGIDNGGEMWRAIAMAARRTGRARAAAARASSLKAKPLGIITKPLKAAGRVLPAVVAGLDYLDGRSQGEDRVRAAVGAGGAAAGAWYGAAQGGMGGAALGALTGPAAPIASPVLGFVGAVGGGFAGSGVGGWAADRVDGLIRGDRGSGKQAPVSRAIASSTGSTTAPQQPMQSPYIPTSPKVENINTGILDNSPWALAGTAGIYGVAGVGAAKLTQAAYNAALNPRTEAPLAAARSSKKATDAIMGLGGFADSVFSKGAKGPYTGSQVPSPGYSPQYGGVQVRPASFGSSPVGGVARVAAPRNPVYRAGTPSPGYAPQQAAPQYNAPSARAGRVVGVPAAIAPGGMVSEADSFKRVGNRWVKVAKVPIGTKAVNIIDSARGALQGLRNSGLPQSVSQMGRGGKTGLAVAGVAGLGAAVWAGSKVLMGSPGTPWGQGPSILDPFGLFANPGGRQAITDAQQQGQNARTGSTNQTRLQTSKQQAEATVVAAALRLQGQREKLVYQATGRLPGSAMGAGGRDYSGPAFGQGGARVSPGAGSFKPPQVAAAEATAKGASDRQRVQTGGQVRVAEIGANAGITKQRIQTGGQVRVADLTTARNLQGRVYEADAGVKRQAIQTGGQVRVADITTGRNLQGRMYEADAKLQGTDLETGRRLQGQTYEADTKRAIAGIETGGKIRTAEIGEEGATTRQRIQSDTTLKQAEQQTKIEQQKVDISRTSANNNAVLAVAAANNKAINDWAVNSPMAQFNKRGREDRDKAVAANLKNQGAIAAEEEKTRRAWLLKSLGL